MLRFLILINCGRSFDLTTFVVYNRLSDYINDIYAPGSQSLNII